jgi:hypothetical protein
MRKLKHEYQYFSDEYKGVVFTFLAGIQHNRGDFSLLPRNVMAMILLVYPDYSTYVDSGFILIVDPNGFRGWQLSNRILNNYPTQGWKFPQYSVFGTAEAKAVVDTWIENPQHTNNPIRRAIAAHNKKGIFNNRQIIKYCLKDCHLHNMTFVYVAESAGDVPERLRGHIQKIYANVPSHVIANGLGYEFTRIRKIRQFKIERTIFDEFHIFGT